jgi:hypothetical protein
VPAPEPAPLSPARPEPCGNQFCRRVREEGDASYCQECRRAFETGYFCDYCSQVYTLHSEKVDGKKWIGCDFCERWNHLDCELARNPLTDLGKDYRCLQCSKKSVPEPPKRKKGVVSRTALAKNLPRLPCFEMGSRQDSLFGLLPGLLALHGTSLTRLQTQPPGRRNQGRPHELPGTRLPPVPRALGALPEKASLNSYSLLGLQEQPVQQHGDCSPPPQQQRPGRHPARTVLEQAGGQPPAQPRHLHRHPPQQHE